jgi:hypothetical protein
VGGGKKPSRFRQCGHFIFLVKKRIAFSRDGAIWTVDRDGHTKRVTSAENDSSPAWRPAVGG